jgi:SLT domain-containing protein
MSEGKIDKENRKENPFIKKTKELIELNKDKEFIKIIAKNKKDRQVAKNLTDLINSYIKKEMEE